jgi:hypothetical protein
MDTGTVLGVVGLIVTLILGGLGIAYGGYSVKADYPVLAVLSYVLGSGLVAGAVVAGILIIMRQQATPAPSVMSTGESRPTEPLAPSIASVPTAAPAPEIVSSITPKVTLGTPTITEDTTPQYLADLRKNRTELQAETLIARYIGKSLKISGKIQSVSSTERGRSIVSFETENIGDAFVMMWFDQKWSDRLSVFQKGDKITVIGKLKSVGKYDVQLDNCEIVDIGQ